VVLLRRTARAAATSAPPPIPCPCPPAVLSSLFDFVIFAILLWVLHADPAEFQTGWFIESLATQILVVFVIRTHASPFWRSRPSPA